MSARYTFHIAEKNSVARELANILKGQSGVIRVLQATGIYSASIENGLQFESSSHVVTAVNGHMFDLDFPAEYSHWSAVDSRSLFSAPVVRSCKRSHSSAKRNLVDLGSRAGSVVLWTDCDMEGEAIAFEAISCIERAVDATRVYRAHFSAVTRNDVVRALSSLRRPNRCLDEAVRFRQEVDLRAGAAFTRLLTLNCRSSVSGDTKVVSWGPCQFPTLGFVVERFLARSTFVSREFYTVEIRIQAGSSNFAELSWDRGRLYTQQSVTAIREYLESVRNYARVSGLTTEEVTKRRPLPMNTLSLLKLGSSKLRMSSSRVMAVAENLYRKGLISYPRTETEKFIKTIPLMSIVQTLSTLNEYQTYCGQLLTPGQENAFQWPSAGPKDDNAHPPIHPVQAAGTATSLDSDERRVYDLICRYFLACCSNDAKGLRTRLTVSVVDERFSASSVCIVQENWLQICRQFESWTSSNSGLANIPLEQLSIGTPVTVTEIAVKTGTTTPPELLSESDLLSLMDEHGIGTDATAHEHIKTIQERQYATQIRSGGIGVCRICPTPLGIALVVGFSEVYGRFQHSIDATQSWHNLALPDLRSSMERSIKRIANGETTREQALAEHVGVMARHYDIFVNAVSSILNYVQTRDQYTPLVSQICPRQGRRGNTSATNGFARRPAGRGARPAGRGSRRSTAGRRPRTTTGQRRNPRPGPRVRRP